MSFRPTNILEWILVGYGGVVLVVSLLLTPLIIGLGDDNANSSPMRTLQSWSGLSSFQTRSSRRGRRRWKARVRHRRPSFSRARAVAPGSEPCQAALDRLISCSQDAATKTKLKKGMKTFVSDCRESSTEVGKAKRCVKRSNCGAFVACLSRK